MWVYYIGWYFSCCHQLNFITLQANAGVEKDNLILVYGGGCLHAISSIDGEVAWKKEFSLEGYLACHLSVFSYCVLAQMAFMVIFLPFLQV